MNFKLIHANEKGIIFNKRHCIYARTIIHCRCIAIFFYFLSIETLKRKREKKGRNCCRVFGIQNSEFVENCLICPS